MDNIDIIEQLRKEAEHSEIVSILLNEAAHEIEELRALVIVYKEGR